MSRFSEDEYLQMMRQNPRIRPVTGPPTPIRPTLETLARPKPAKYRNRKTADGFDSEKERRLWQELELRAKAGEITDLQRQIKFALVVNGLHVCDYVADFVWREGERRVICDCKSVMTRKLPVYRIKFKLMQACHAISIEER